MRRVSDWFSERKEEKAALKHRLAIIDQDRVIFKEVDKYPDKGVIKFDKKKYYLNPARRNHVFIAGFVNEVDGVNLQKMAKEPESGFEPDYTFMAAYEEKVLDKLFARGEGEKTVTDYIIYALMALMGIIIYLVWQNSQSISSIMSAMGLN